MAWVPLLRNGFGAPRRRVRRARWLIRRWCRLIIAFYGRAASRRGPPCAALPCLRRVRYAALDRLRAALARARAGSLRSLPPAPSRAARSSDACASRGAPRWPLALAFGDRYAGGQPPFGFPSGDRCARPLGITSSPVARPPPFGRSETRLPARVAVGAPGAAAPPRRSRPPFLRCAQSGWGALLAAPPCAGGGAAPPLRSITAPVPSLRSVRMGAVPPLRPPPKRRSLAAGLRPLCSTTGRWGSLWRLGPPASNRLPQSLGVASGGRGWTPRPRRCRFPLSCRFCRSVLNSPLNCFVGQHGFRIAKKPCRNTADDSLSS